MSTAGIACFESDKMRTTSMTYEILSDDGTGPRRSGYTLSAAPIWRLIMFKRSVVYALCLAILNLASPSLARAELVGTLRAVESTTRAHDLATISSGLARDEVRAKFVELGVNPTQVEARLAALTDSELRTLAQRMDQLPAGGDALAIIGLVFLVLMILEFVGVIDIFKKFP
jgi:hypothetical protein